MLAVEYIQLFEVKKIPYILQDPTRTIIPKSNSTIYCLKSLTHEGNKIWNRLSVDIKTSERLVIFMIKIIFATNVLNTILVFNCFYPLYTFKLLYLIVLCLCYNHWRH